MPPEHYEQAVARAVELIRGGRAARRSCSPARCSCTRPRAYDPAAVFGVLREEFPSCFCFCVGRGEATLVAASPELLRAPRGPARQHARARRLDAPQRRPGRRRPPRRAAAARPRATAKSTRSSPGGSSARCARTRSGSPPRPSRSSCGSPTSSTSRPRSARSWRRPIDALELAGADAPHARRRAASRWSAAAPLIPALEGLDRGWYAGPVGWTDATGDGEFCVALRCALLRGAVARCYAGNGIVRDSDPAARARRDRGQAAGAAPAARAPERAAQTAAHSASVQLDVRRALGATSTIAEPSACERALERRAKAREVGDALVPKAVELGGGREVQARRRGDVARVDVVACAVRSATTGRKSKMPPPPLSSSTIVSSSSRRRAASSPPMSCASATSPISSTTGPARRGGRAEGAGDRPVDAVGAAVAQHPRRVGRAPARSSRCRAPASRRPRTASPRAGSSTPSSAATAGSRQRVLRRAPRAAPPRRARRRCASARASPRRGVRGAAARAGVLPRSPPSPTRVRSRARECRGGSSASERLSTRARVLPGALGVERDLRDAARGPPSHVRSGLETGRSPTRSTRSGRVAPANARSRSSAS